MGVNSRVPSRTLDALRLRYRDIVRFYSRAQIQPLRGPWTRVLSCNAVSSAKNNDRWTRSHPPTPQLRFPCAWMHESFPSHNRIVPVCRLLENNRRESAVADVIRLSTMQTKEGFDSRLQLPHTKTAGTPGHSQTDLSLLARTTSCSSRMRHSPTTARPIKILPVPQLGPIAIWRNGCRETLARVRRAQGKHFGLQKI